MDRHLRVTHCQNHQHQHHYHHHMGLLMPGCLHSGTGGLQVTKMGPFGSMTSSEPWTHWILPDLHGFYKWVMEALAVLNEFVFKVVLCSLWTGSGAHNTFATLRLCNASPMQCQWADRNGVGHRTSRCMRYLCGFLEELVADDLCAWTKSVASDYCDADFWMLNKSFGVSFAWLPRWRRRMLVHRAYFQGEATIFNLMRGPSLLRTARTNPRCGGVHKIPLRVLAVQGTPR